MLLFIFSKKRYLTVARSFGMAAWRRIRPCRKQRYGAYSRKLTDIWNRIKRKEKRREEKGKGKEGTNKRTPKALSAIDPGELREKATALNKQLSRMNKAEEKQPPKLQEDYLPRLEKYESQSEKLKKKASFRNTFFKMRQSSFIVHFRRTGEFPFPYSTTLFVARSGESENSLSPILPLCLSPGPENRKIPSPLFYHFICRWVRRIGEFPLPYPTTLFVDGSGEPKNSLSPILPLYLLPGPEK